MNYFRNVASGKRNRYKQNNYDLDLTYITTRIIAMSFPASGMEKIYRNSIDSVAQFLEQEHGENYLVFNFSDRKYNYNKFKNKVVDYEWKDHHAPKILVLFQACQEMYEFLKEDDKNVIVVHWNAGKGRTGTSIASFLVYWGLANNATEAINYYGWKRFSTGKGVSQPWQLRYIHYFEAVYKQKVLWSLPKILDCLIITTVPKINQNGWKPYMDILNGNYAWIHTTKNSIHLKKYKSGPKDTEEYNIIKIMPEKQNLVISGDVHFMIKHKGSFNNTSICRFSINTGFWDNEVEIPKSQISPDSVAVSKKFHEKFKITVVLKDFWDTWSKIKDKVLKPLDMCDRWKLKTPKATKEWESINSIIEKHEPYPSKETGEKLWFTDEIDYYEKVNNTLVINCEQYNWIKDDSTTLQSTNDGLEQHKSEVDEEEEFKHEMASSKEDRNTLVANRDTLENVKSKDSEFNRSVNEFHGENENTAFKSKEILGIKQEDSKDNQNNNVVEINDLSSSTGSNNSGTSEPGYRQLKRTSKKYLYNMSITNYEDENTENKNGEDPNINFLLNPDRIQDKLEVRKKTRRSSSANRM